ncbi:cytosolic carboxypeptidase 3 [Bombina bombina]|uniref:cytosolic carboxypeptidase 3 n=1 Tax=Bombina bombina TaxID=8345 RepID=UPI00235A711C|nr:cytosolic carboxypeptidase 3 [Bombina bombina]
MWLRLLFVVRVVNFFGDDDLKYSNTKAPEWPSTVFARKELMAFSVMGDQFGIQLTSQHGYWSRGGNVTSLEQALCRVRPEPLNSNYNPFSQRTTQIIFEYQSGRRVARLREPRDLYGVSSSICLHLPRWPYDCEVLKERVNHIEWDPPTPEPMYRPTGLEKGPVCREIDEGKVVYAVDEGSKESYFLCSRVGVNRIPLKNVSLQTNENSSNTLIFESRFESGNLQKAVQVGNYEYELTLRTDLYTQRHTQWYYFRVKNTRTGVPYRFTIINFMKPSSLYSHGMRPLMYSEMNAKTNHIGWHRIGKEIKYFKNNFGQNGQQYYSLSWTFEFPHNGDTCYFAHCYSYTYSNLQDYLAEIANDPERSSYCKIRVLCHSLAGNMVYVLTITNPSPSKEEQKKKKAVIVTARVHPGETNSSWMMKGFLDYILSTRSDARLLRDTFIFKVVPMLNPDGVIVGNYRCSLSGRDLNRNYKSRLKDSFPSVWFTRNMVKRVMEEREILLYCDLHGHSRKQNVFMYGCKTKGAQAHDSRLFERIFPLMFSKNCPEKFSFSDCKFKVQRSKEGTGRVVMWKMGIRNSYTLEATFCGSTMGKRRGTHFSTKDLETLGHHFCDTLLDYCDPDESKYFLCLKELGELLKEKTICRKQKLEFDSETIFLDVLSDLDSSTNGSDSTDSNGPPAHLMQLASQVKPRKKLLKTKKERNYKRQQKGELKALAEKQPPFITEQEANLRHMHVRTSGNLPDLQKRTKSRKHISKLHREQLLQDLDTKKVSVVYLAFNANGEVITTKSHSYLRKENMMEITNSLNRFHWNKPLPLFQNILAQGFPFSNILNECPYNTHIYNKYTSQSNLSIEGSNQESGGENKVNKPVNSLVSSLQKNQAEYPSCIRSLGGKEIHPDKKSMFLPCEPMDPNLLLSSKKTSGSTPACTTKAATSHKASLPDHSSLHVPG